MQEFASRNARPPAPPTEHWPTAEELAAYIDGTLEEPERERITEHLASCEECYAVYAETLHFQMESKAAPAAENVLPLRRREPGSGSWWWRAAAATLLVGMGAGWGVFFLAPPPALPTSELTSPFFDKPKLLKNLWVGPTTRGLRDPEEGDEQDWRVNSFQMGVQLLNLQLALESNDKDRALSDLLPRLQQILEREHISPLQASYKALSADLKRSGSKPAGALLTAASQLAQDSRDYFDEEYLDLGQWVEGSFLAASTRDPSFWRQEKQQGFLRRLLWRQKLGLGETRMDPEILRELNEASKVLEERTPDASDFKRLSQALEKILDLYYPAT